MSYLDIILLILQCVLAKWFVIINIREVVPSMIEEFNIEKKSKHRNKHLMIQRIGSKIISDDSERKHYFTYFVNTESDEVYVYKGKKVHDFTKDGECYHGDLFSYGIKTKELVLLNNTILLHVDAMS